MHSHDLTIISPDPETHLDAIADLVGKTFNRRGFYESRRRCREWGIRHSHYDWKASRIGLLDGKVITHFGVWRIAMRMGSATVQCAGVGMVATHGDYHKRGLMAATIPEALSAMKDEGYALSLLFGIPDYYDRFGYVRAWSPTNYIVKREDLPFKKPIHRVSKIKPVQREELVAIYNREHARLTGTAVRPTYVREFAGGPWEGRLWRNDAGETVGYLFGRFEGRRLLIADTGGPVDEILRVAGRLCREGHCDDVEFVTPHGRSELVAQLRRGNCREVTGHYRCAGPMIRAVDFESMVTQTKQDLSRRLAASTMKGWTGVVEVSLSERRVGLAFDAHGVTVRPGVKSRHHIRGGGEVIRLLLGADDPHRIVADAGLKVGGEMKVLAPILFPNQQPVINRCDQI